MRQALRPALSATTGLCYAPLNRLPSIRSPAAIFRWPPCWSTAATGTRRWFTPAPRHRSPLTTSRCGSKPNARQYVHVLATGATGSRLPATPRPPKRSPALHDSIEAVITARVASAAMARARGEPQPIIDVLGDLPAVVPMIAGLAFWPTLIVAQIDAGQIQRAEDLIDGLNDAAAARALDFEARLSDLRARLAVAQGRPEEASVHFDAALARLGSDDPLLDRALTHHAYGKLLRAKGQPPAGRHPVAHRPPDAQLPRRRPFPHPGGRRPRSNRDPAPPAGLGGPRWRLTDCRGATWPSWSLRDSPTPRSQNSSTSAAKPSNTTCTTPPRETRHHLTKGTAHRPVLNGAGGLVGSAASPREVSSAILARTTGCVEGSSSGLPPQTISN